MDKRRVRVGALSLAAICAVAVAVALFGNAVTNGSQETDGARAADAAAQAPNVRVSSVPASEDAYEPAQLIVGLAPESNEDAMREALDGLGIGTSEELMGAADGFGAMLLVTTDSLHAAGSALAQAEHAVAALPGVTFVQPNYRYASAAASDIARDEDVQAGRQYYLDSWEETHGAGIAEAWGKTNPAVKVDVAVLDTGVYSMEERSGGKLVEANPENFHQEFDADNLDMSAGVDFVHSGSEELLPLVNEFNPTGDDNGHGTHIAAIIAANAQTDATPDKRADGMAGVSPNARIVPIKVLDGVGDGDVKDFVRAYEYLMSDEFLAGHNLRIVNMSLAVAVDDDAESEGGGSLHAASVEDARADGADGQVQAQESEHEGVPKPDGAIAEGFNTEEPYDSALHEVIQRAQAKGIVTVCAAGNVEEAVDDEDEGDEPSINKAAETYPSDYPECISVMALDKDGNIAPYSYVNPNKDIAAPGGSISSDGSVPADSGIYSAWATQADAYMTLAGTSQATAIVSGVLSMMWAANPDLTVQQAKSALYGPTEGESGTSRMLNAATTLERVGAGQYSDWKDVEWHTSRSIADADVVPHADELVYTGKKLTTPVDVYYNNRKLVQNTDYTVAYSSNINPGTAKVIVKGKGRYYGSQTGTFDIVLGKTKIKKLKAGARSFTVKWARQKAGKVSYQVRYSLKKNMKKAKVKTVKKNAKTKLKARGLKSGKTYYVQVRTFKKIAGKKCYGTWSPKKSVKVK